jgi:ribosomal protein S27AE
MVKAKPFVIEYHEERVLMGREFLDAEGNPFKSIKAMKESKEYESSMILFCPNCGAGNRTGKWGFEDTPYANKLKKHKGQCPNCGERLILEYAEEISRARIIDKTKSDEQCEKEHQIFVTFVGGTNPAIFPKALKWWEVQDDKLVFETVSDLYLSRTMYGKYWLQHETLRYRYIFNLKTGQCYMMRGVDAKGNPSKYSQQSNRLRNYTFSFLTGVPLAMCNDFVRIVLEALSERKNLEFKTSFDGTNRDEDAEVIYECCNRRIGIRKLGVLNYFSDMKPSDIADLLDMDSFSLTPAIKRNFRNLIDLSSAGEVEWLPKYMQKPSIRRRLKKRVIAYYMYRWLYSVGIRDVNVMNNVVDTYIDVMYNKTPFFDANAPMPMSDIVSRWCLNPSDGTVEFMRWALKDRNAESTCQFIKSLFKLRDYLFSDSVRMYRDLPPRLRPEHAVGNLKDIHDYLMVIDRKWKFGNRPIDYTDAEKALEIDCGEYSFRLAKDTDALYDIGKKMSICVGSYGRSAVSKHCTIMTMAKNNEPVACIELRVNKKNINMVQLKSRFNHTVTEIEPVTEWITMTGVNAECSDYQNAVKHKTSVFDGRYQDYHVENPRLDLPDIQVDDFEIDLNFDNDDMPFVDPLPF